MIDITLWLEVFLQKLNSTFAQRVWFVGLQGSYAREEADESSDIDLVVILDKVAPCDVALYGQMLDTLPHRDKLCGFFSGKQELVNWDVSDLFQFYYDTKPIQGSLGELLPLLDRDAVDRAIKLGACNIYHGCVHNMLHEKSNEILRGLYKSACFTVQAICFRQTGKFVSRHILLADSVAPEEAAIVDTFINMKAGKMTDFREASESLLCWTSKHITE